MGAVHTARAPDGQASTLVTTAVAQRQGRSLQAEGRLRRGLDDEAGRALRALPTGLDDDSNGKEHQGNSQGLERRVSREANGPREKNKRKQAQPNSYANTEHAEQTQFVRRTPAEHEGHADTEAGEGYESKNGSEKSPHSESSYPGAKCAMGGKLRLTFELSCASRQGGRPLALRLNDLQGITVLAAAQCERLPVRAASLLTNLGQQPCGC